MKKPQRIGIVQTAFIGDVVLATPLAEAARRAAPGAEITFVTIPGTANLVDHHPFVDRVVVFDKRGSEHGIAGVRSLSRKLEGLDIALIPHRSFRSAAAAFWAGIPVRVGFENSAGAFLLTHTVPYHRLHEVDRNLALGAAVGLGGEGLAPALFPGREDRRVVSSRLPDRLRAPVVALAPGSIWSTKRWPLDSFVALAQLLRRRLEATLILVGGPGDAELCSELARRSGGVALNSAGRLTLRQSAELLRRCQVAVTNDSAPAHLAAAMGTAVVAIFGPTVTGFGFAPYGAGHRVLERPLPCRPCGWHGGKRCPIGTFECMRSIAPKDVFSAVEEIVRRQTYTPAAAVAKERSTQTSMELPAAPVG